MDKIKQFWDKQAAKYDKNERQFEPVFEKIINLTKKHLDPSVRALDLGCATGTKTIRLAESVKHIHGLDLSTGMITHAKQKAEKLQIGNVEFSQGTIFDKDLTNESFDVIVSYAVMHLLKDIDKCLERINDLLKPGGLFITSTACLKDKMNFKNRFVFSLYMLVKKVGLFPLHLNMFRFEDIEGLIEKNKFEIIEKERMRHGISVSFNVARKN
jgi:2-polyprenyl-3-methyl-5-hydroxy-6-metoxy-1,4-benzoquinol methylase